MKHRFLTGREVEITPVSPWLVSQVRVSVPPPKPPIQLIDYDDGRGKVEIANTAHPDYLAALEKREREISTRVARLFLLRGAAFDVDHAAVTKLRADMAAIGVTLPPEADDDGYCYLYYVCPGSAADLHAFRAKVEGESIVTEEAVANATEAFSGDLEG